MRLSGDEPQQGATGGPIHRGTGAIRRAGRGAAPMLWQGFPKLADKPMGGRFFMSGNRFFRTAAACLTMVAAMLATTPAAASAYLQCVPFARAESGVEIQGNAKSWWTQAAGQYERGHEPRRGAVMAFASAPGMPMGHVAVVKKVVGDREILIDHANWSPINGRRGQIERNVRVIDVSDAGDWSMVRVWYAPIGDLGLRANPVQGFIYADGAAQPERKAFDTPVWTQNDWKPGNGLDIVAASLGG